VARNRTILVVDDAPMFRELESAFLARQGRVLTAASGAAGLELAQRHRPGVILLDLHMPELGGEEVCRQLKEDAELSSIPVVMLTASPFAEDHARCIRAGADQVLAKPISQLALIDVVHRYLRSPGRGMPRAPLDTPVRLLQGSRESWGKARNISRGGMFVESDCAGDAEIVLEFCLPETLYVLTPTATVVWQRRGGSGEAEGVGLRFLCLDGPSARRLGAFVDERTPLAAL
jgi:CheY-like chemotaxis protein